MRLLTAALAAGAIALSAIAAPASAATITAFTPEIVKQVITEAGGTNISQETDNGISYTTFEFNGIPFIYSIQGCDPKVGCVGLAMLIGMQTEKDYSLATLNSYNLKAPFATAMRVDANKIVFGRFVLAAGGITTDNVMVNMGFHMLALQAWSEHLKSAVVASADPAEAGKTLPVNAPTDFVAATKPIRLTPKDVTGIVGPDMLSKAKLTK